jgi:cytochrome P450
MKRLMTPHRMFFEVFDDMYLGSGEKMCLRNILKFREIIKDLIKERRAEMKTGTFKPKHEDFLTMMLNEPFFSESDEMLIDECITFMMAAT